MAASTPITAPKIDVLSANVEKPEIDDRSYRLIRLRDNKLQVLLVHDPNTDKASAAMDVHVGHLSDPKDFQGLAHALEHCLFLGTSASFYRLTKRHEKVSARE
jgi:insulysin